MRPARGVLKLLRGTTLISIKYKKRSNRNKKIGVRSNHYGENLWRKTLRQNVYGKCFFALSQPYWNEISQRLFISPWSSCSSATFPHFIEAKNTGTNVTRKLGFPLICQRHTQKTISSINFTNYKEVTYVPTTMMEYACFLRPSGAWPPKQFDKWQLEPKPRWIFGN